MQVTNYQMHTMLECYSRKLTRSCKNEKTADDPREKIANELALSPESTREATMAKISRQVLDKVTDVVALSISQKNKDAESPGQEDDSAARRGPAEEEFTFNVIDAINRKRTGRLAMGDSATLIRRLERMAEKAVTNNTESWV
jgi:hypothetical protein